MGDFVRAALHDTDASATASAAGSEHWRAAHRRVCRGNVPQHRLHRAVAPYHCGGIRESRHIGKAREVVPQLSRTVGEQLRLNGDRHVRVAQQKRVTPGEQQRVGRRD